MSSGSDALAREHFTRIFRRQPATVASAPGRVNLIGEHTDYNGGYVLPMAIPQRTWVAVAEGPEGRARASSRNLGGGDRVREFRIGAEAPTRSWVDYVQGVTQALARDGHALGGFDLAIVSDVPLGSGPPGTSDAIASTTCWRRSSLRCWLWSGGPRRLA